MDPKSDDFSSLISNNPELSPYFQYFCPPYFTNYEIHISSDLLIGILQFIFRRVSERRSITTHKYFSALVDSWLSCGLISDDLHKTLLPSSFHSAGQIQSLASNIATLVKSKHQNLRNYQDAWNFSLLSKIFEVTIATKQIECLTKVKIYERVDCPISIHILSLKNDFVIFRSDLDSIVWLFGYNLKNRTFLKTIQERPSTKHSAYLKHYYCRSCRGKPGAGDLLTENPFCGECFSKNKQCLAADDYDPLFTWSYLLTRSNAEEANEASLPNLCVNCKTHKADGKICYYCNLETKILSKDLKKENSS